MDSMACQKTLPRQMEAICASTGKWVRQSGALIPYRNYRLLNRDFHLRLFHGSGDLTYMGY